MPVPQRETSLWLIRHPEPEPSAKGMCYGALDVSLSPAGIRHAGAIARALRERSFDAIYSSPSRRCMDAAGKIATGRRSIVQPLDALSELNFGDLEGRSYDEIAVLYPGLYHSWMERPTETEFPGGESFSQMCVRVLAATSTLLAAHEGGTILFMTHGGPIRIILADALGMPMPNIFRIAQRYGAINNARYSNGTPTVDMMNVSVQTLRAAT